MTAVNNILKIENNCTICNTKKMNMSVDIFKIIIQEHVIFNKPIHVHVIFNMSIHIHILRNQRGCSISLISFKFMEVFI